MQNTPPSRRTLLALAGGGTMAAVLPVTALAGTASAPAPFGATPTPRQLAWHKMETYGFLHFTVNTFTDREWGLGDEDPKIFNPTDFDADQIVTACKAGGLKQLILTAKHHDGFCLWPSRYTEHSIKNSPFQGGKGDIVRDISQACARHGVKFGVYLSPWDRNHPEYGRAGYIDYYFNLLNELLTQYGKIYEVWFDGANGGDGYYGGARETRHIDGETYYQWDRVRETVRRLQPDAVMFADAHMDIRWVGNENGVAGDPCWPTMDETPYTPEKGNSGIRGGDLWNPAETDVSIRPGWFWHADEDDKVRSPANLLDLYLHSVGRGSNLLLNVPPNRTGRIPDSDVKNLAAFRTILDKAYAENLATDAVVTASSRFSAAHGPEKVLAADGFWAAKTSDCAGAWLQFTFRHPVRFDLIRLREALPFGVRVDDYEIDVEQDGQWQTVSRHTCIGPQRVIRLDAPVTAHAVRLRFTKAAASPVLSEFSLHLLPDLVDEPSINRDRNGQVTLKPAGPGQHIVYTLDGSAPDAHAMAYDGPFALADGGTVRAMALKPSGATSGVVTADFDAASGAWTVTADGVAAPGLFDGSGADGKAGQPMEIVLDLAHPYTLKGFTLTPANVQRIDVATAEKMGPPGYYTAWVSDDGKTWGEPVASGEFANIAASRAVQKVRFATPHKGRYLRLELPRAVQGKPIVTVAAVGILTR